MSEKMAAATDAQERQQDEADALADLRQAVRDNVADEWLLGFVRQYPFRDLAAQPAAQAVAPIGYISDGVIEHALAKGFGASTYIQAGQPTADFPIAIYALAQQAPYAVRDAEVSMRDLADEQIIELHDDMFPRVVFEGDEIGGNIVKFARKLQSSMRGSR